MLQNIWPFGLAMLCGGHNEQINVWGGGGGVGGVRQVEGTDELLGRKWLGIHREASVQAQCMTWLFAYFDLPWVMHGGPWSQVPCRGRDAMEVRRCYGHMQASL